MLNYEWWHLVIALLVIYIYANHFFMNLTYMFYNFNIFCLPATKKYFNKTWLWTSPMSLPPSSTTRLLRWLLSTRLACQPQLYTYCNHGGTERPRWQQMVVYPEMEFLDTNLTKKTRVFCSMLYSQSLPLADFKKNHSFLWFWKSLQKNPQNKKTRVYS